MFGIRNATLNASPAADTPKKCAKTADRKRPRTRLEKIPIATRNAARPVRSSATRDDAHHVLSRRRAHDIHHVVPVPR